MYRIRAAALKEVTVVPQPQNIPASSSYESLEAGARKAAQALNISPIPTMIYTVYHKLTSNVRRGVGMNDKDPVTGETALAVACRLGDYEAVQCLLSLESDISIPANDGCLPLHWLFMFDVEQVE